LSWGACIYCWLLEVPILKWVSTGGALCANALLTPAACGECSLLGIASVVMADAFTFKLHAPPPWGAGKGPAVGVAKGPAVSSSSMQLIAGSLMAHNHKAVG
jgi:hypothetical protein